MKKSTLAFALIALSRPAFAADMPVPEFADETKSAGINSVYAGDWQYMVGGGAAAFDCNDDGFADLYLAGGEKPSKFYANKSAKGGELKFAEQKSGLELDAVTGAYPLDADSDGKADLVVLRVGENVIMRGLGGCRFERANEAWNFAGGDAWNTAFAATWEKGNRWPTLAIGSYVDRKEEMFPWGTCTDNLLFRPENAQAEKFARPLALKPSYCPLSMMFTDWNRSGTPSLRVSNDREYYKGGQEQMWKVEPGKAPELYTQKEGWRYLRIWGMGIASYDLNFDSYPEYFLTSMADNKLQTLAEVPKEGRPKPSYADVAFKPVQDGANRDAIGAWIEVKCGADVMRREITSGGGHVSGTLTWHHFGIGTEKTAEVRLIWPDGTAGEWQTVAAGKFYMMEKGKVAAEWAAK